MAALASTDTSILGNGLNENVRSYMLERVIDFAVASLGSSAYYELGALPKGFVPRNIAIVELTKASASSTVKVYGKASGDEIASLAVGGSTLGFAVKPFDAATVSSSTATITPTLDETLCLKLGAAFTAGRVKVVVSGDRMTGIWDEGEKATPIKPSVAVPINKLAD